MRHGKQPEREDQLTHFMTEVKPLTEGARIIEAVGHWADDESFIAPAFIIATSEGKLVKPIVSTDSKLTARGSILTEDLGTSSH